MITKSKNIINKLFKWYILPTAKDFDVVQYCETYLKNNQYDKRSDGNKKTYLKGFVIVELYTHKSEKRTLLHKVIIKHDIPNAKEYHINENHATGLLISCSHMERI